jgi:formate dehydrogenase maturation protein FdhE
MATAFLLQVMVLSSIAIIGAIYVHTKDYKERKKQKKCLENNVNSNICPYCKSSWKDQEIRFNVDRTLYLRCGNCKLDWETTIKKEK